MTKDELKYRFKMFSISIIKLVNEMPRTIASDAIARQIVRSGTSPSANYRAACVAKSDKDFINKLKIVQEELDETSQWLDIISETEMLKSDKLPCIQQECNELYKIICSSILTVKARMY